MMFESAFVNKAIVDKAKETNLERLRDEFAMAALTGLIAYPNKDGHKCGQKGVPILAGFAYEYADAMLKAREQYK